MHALTAVDPDTIFAKTPKGREEIAQRLHKLGANPRRVLIVIDGSKNLQAIASLIPAIIPSHELEQILSFLQQHGFIVANREQVQKPSWWSSTSRPRPRRRTRLRPTWRRY